MRDITRHLPKNLLRPEIRRRALRAATAVAVGAIAGCGSLDEPVAGAQYADASAGADGVIAMRGGSDTTARTPLDAGRVAADAGSTAADAGAVATDSVATDSVATDTGSRAVDAGTTGTDTSPARASDATAGDIKGGTTTGVVCASSDGWEDYKRCCDDNGWDWNKGCSAWGPPAPPMLDEAALAALISGLHAMEVMA